MAQDRQMVDKIAIRPLTDEKAEHLDDFIQKSRTLVERIRKRRKGKPVPSSWKLIRQARKGQDH